MTYLAYLPVSVFLMVVGFIIWYKTRNIGVPVIIMLAFMTSAGAAFVPQIGIMGFIMGGAVILAIVALMLRIFY
jgi:hypothetical protein